MLLLKRIILCLVVFISFENISAADWTLLGLEGKSVLTVSVHPTKDSILLVGTDNEGIFRSKDKGKTWENIWDSSSIYNIAINRKSPDMIFATTEGALLFSRSFGNSFRKIEIPCQDIPNCIVFDETQSKSVIIGTPSGLYKTFDFGKTWLSAGLEDMDIFTIGIDNFGSKPVLYAGTTVEGIFKSSNFGVSWTPTNKGIHNLEITALLCDRKLHNLIYAGTLRGGAYMSNDYGSNWEMISIELKSLLGYALAQSVDPKFNRSVVYIGNYSGEVYKTADGETFTQVGNKIEGNAVLCLGVSNLLPSTLYIGTTNGIYFMEDK